MVKVAYSLRYIGDRHSGTISTYDSFKRKQIKWSFPTDSLESTALANVVGTSEFLFLIHDRSPYHGERHS